MSRFSGTSWKVRAGGAVLAVLANAIVIGGELMLFQAAADKAVIARTDTVPSVREPVLARRTTRAGERG